MNICGRETERAYCEEIKARVIAHPRINVEFYQAEQSFPGITQQIPPTKAVDLIMKIIIISSEQGRRGIEPGAVLKDIRCYKNWLARVERGSNVDDDSSYTTIKQSQIHNIDIKDKIVPFYQHMYDESL